MSLFVVQIRSRKYQEGRKMAIWISSEPPAPLRWFLMIGGRRPTTPPTNSLPVLAGQAREADSAGNRKLEGALPAIFLQNEGSLPEPPSGLARGR